MTNCKRLTVRFHTDTRAGANNQCPHDPASHVFLSGTKVREMLSRGEYPPPEFSRPEVIDALMEGLRESR